MPFFITTSPQRELKSAEFADCSTSAIHGTHAAQQSATARYRSTHACWHSSAADASSGGVCIFVANEVLATTSARHYILVLGRAHAVLLRFLDGTGLALCNIHNEKLLRHQICGIHEFLDRHFDEFYNFGSLFIIGGDMNFHPPGEDGHTHTHINASGAAHTRLNTNEQRRWRPLLRRFAPISPPTFTRVATATAGDDTHDAIATGSTIDYALTSAPSAILTHLRVTVECKAFSTHSLALSDHTPVVTTIRAPRKTRQGHTPIPLWIARHPIFAAVASARMQHIDPDRLDPRDADRRTVQALHHAARVTFRRCANRTVTDPIQKLSFAMALTRALARGNGSAAARLLSTLPSFRQAVAERSDGGVRVTDAALLDQLLAATVREADAVHKDSSRPTTSTTRPDRAATQRQLTHWQALWLPFGRRAVLSKVLPDPTATDVSDLDERPDFRRHDDLATNPTPVASCRAPANNDRRHRTRHRAQRPCDSHRRDSDAQPDDDATTNATTTAPDAVTRSRQRPRTGNVTTHPRCPQGPLASDATRADAPTACADQPRLRDTPPPPSATTTPQTGELRGVQAHSLEER